MSVSPQIVQAMEGSSFIRKMFEEGIALKKKYGEDKVFDFSIGNPDLDPPEDVLKAIKETALDEAKGVHGYMPNPGYPETRGAIAEKVSLEQGLQGDKALSFNNVVMSTGAAGALNCVFKSILSPGDNILVIAPFFVEYRSYAANHGGVLVPVAAKPDFSIDIDAIAAKLDEKTAAVLINSPNNPTGKVYTDDDIKALAAVLEAHGKKCGRKPWLIADEPYRNIIYGGRHVAPVFQYYDEAVVVSSFAKDLSLPGERIGYIAVNPSAEDAKVFIDACAYTTRTLGYVNAPGFFQRVIAKCWNAQADYSSYEKRRDALTAVMRNAGIEYAEPEGAFYLFCKVPAPKAGSEGEAAVKAGKTLDGAFCDHLKKYNILGVPGSGFGCAGYIRLAYCCSMKTIENSRDSFALAVKEW